MNSISFACPLCSGVFQIDTQQEASQVYCPHCNKIIDIPSQEALNEQNKTSPTASPSEPQTKPQRPRKRRKKKSPAPVPTNNVDLFPPGYVPDSAATEATSNVPEPATPEPATPEPATPEPATPEPATPEPATPEPATPEPAGIEALLPPGVNAGATGQPAATDPSSETSPPTGKSATVDHLLPASVAASTPENRFAGIEVPGIGDSLEAGSETPQIALLEPVKMVAVRGKEVELKQRTPEEKLRWRRRKNILMWTTGILILLGTLFAMTR